MARTKWKELGLELGIDPTSVDVIAQRCRDDPNRCFSDLLQQWLEGHGDPPRTWSTIKTALMKPSVNEGSVAEGLY